MIFMHIFLFCTLDRSKIMFTHRFNRWENSVHNLMNILIVSILTGII